MSEAPVPAWLGGSSEPKSDVSDLLSVEELLDAGVLDSPAPDREIEPGVESELGQGTQRTGINDSGPAVDFSVDSKAAELVYDEKGGGWERLTKGVGRAWSRVISACQTEEGEWRSWLYQGKWKEAGIKVGTGLYKTIRTIAPLLGGPMVSVGVGLVWAGESTYRFIRTLRKQENFKKHWKEFALGGGTGMVAGVSVYLAGEVMGNLLRLAAEGIIPAGQLGLTIGRVALMGARRLTTPHVRQLVVGQAVALLGEMGFEIKDRKAVETGVMTEDEGQARKDWFNAGVMAATTVTVLAPMIKNLGESVGAVRDQAEVTAEPEPTGTPIPVVPTSTPGAVVPPPVVETGEPDGEILVEPWVIGERPTEDQLEEADILGQVDWDNNGVPDGQGFDLDNDGDLDCVVFDDKGMAWRTKDVTDDGVEDFAYDSAADADGLPEAWYSEDQLKMLDPTTQRGSGGLMSMKRTENLQPPQPVAVDTDGDGDPDVINQGGVWFADLNGDNIFGADEQMTDVTMSYDSSSGWQVDRVEAADGTSYVFDKTNGTWVESESTDDTVEPGVRRLSREEQITLSDGRQLLLSGSDGGVEGMLQQRLLELHEGDPAWTAERIGQVAHLTYLDEIAPHVSSEPIVHSDDDLSSILNELGLGGLDIIDAALRSNS